MRYKETGRVHMDFHRTMNGTIAYLHKKYSEEFLDETFRRTAHEVYRSIWEDLKHGNTRQLVEHWRYFFSREGGDYAFESQGDEIRMTVNCCPAIAYLQKRGVKVDSAFCHQTMVVNAALSEDTPFQIETKVLGNGRCVQTIRKRS